MNLSIRVILSTFNVFVTSENRSNQDRFSCWHWEKISPRQALGPPRQARGPPRSGAGVGVGILRGFAVSWKIQRFKKLLVQKKQDSPRIQSYLEIPKIQQIDGPKIPRFTRIQNDGKWSILFNCCSI